MYVALVRLLGMLGHGITESDGLILNNWGYLIIENIMVLSVPIISNNYLISKTPGFGESLLDLTCVT